MKEPVDHILRPSLPWRTVAAVTECGYDAAKVKTLTRADYFARLKDYGQQRSALVTCMTCAQTADRYPTWEDEPRLALGREIEWEQVHWGWSNRGGQRAAISRDGRGHLLKDELEAIAAIIAAHRVEFDDLVAKSIAIKEWQALKDSNNKKPGEPKRSGKWYPV